MNWLRAIWTALSTPLPAKGQADTPVAPDILGSLTPRAQQVLMLARKEAERFHHSFVGTEHLLLGLIRLGQGTAVTVLQKLGLELDTVRLEVEKQIGTGPDEKPSGPVLYTPRVKKVLAFAAKQARALSHQYVGTEHVLLGLLLEGDGVAARVLKNLNVDVEQTRLEILKELDPNFTSNAAEALPSPDKSTVAGPSTQGEVRALKPDRECIDTTKRYDVYCAEGNQPLVVYRDVLFKDTKVLFKKNASETFSEFIEIEHADGQIIYLNRFSVIKFCEHRPAPPPGGSP